MISKQGPEFLGDIDLFIFGFGELNIKSLIRKMEPPKTCASKIVKEEMINLNRLGEPDSPSHCGYCDKN